MPLWFNKKGRLLESCISRLGADVADLRYDLMHIGRDIVEIGIH